MAPEPGDADPEDGIDEDGHSSVGSGKAEKQREREEDEDMSEEEEDEEPRLKYASLTKHLKSVYRNGDATSTSLVAGDKMVKEMV